MTLLNITIEDVNGYYEQYIVSQNNGLKNGSADNHTPGFLKNVVDMKKSKRLLITIAGASISLLIICLFFIRSQLSEYLEAERLQSNYETFPVEKFQGLDFASNYVATINQGRGV